MQNKDNLEEFIKREVNRIEFDDADSMWQEFQARLEKEKPKPQRGFWYWAGIFSLFLFIALGSFLLGSIFNQVKTADVKKDENTSIKKETSPSIQSTSEPNQAQPSNNLLDADDYDNSTQTGEEINPKLEKKAPVNSNNPKSADINFRSKKDNSAKKVNDRIVNQNIQGSPVSTVMDSTEMQEDFEQVDSEKAGFAEINDQESLDEPVKLLAPIAGIKLEELLPLNSEKNPPLVVTKYEWKATEPKRLFFSIENSFASHGIRQHAVGFGKYIPLKNNFTLKVQAGGSLDIGYSFSQDSVFIFNGLSIEEIRKDKDLKNIWNAYLDLGVYHRKNRWQMGLGIRGSYALFNQYYYDERTLITSIGSIVGNTNQWSGKGNWSGINRMSFDAYLNVNYQMNTNYSVGLFAGKRLNELIKKDMAKQAYSNTPVKFGVVINRYF